MFRCIISLYFIFVVGCSPKPMFPIVKKNTSSILVKNNIQNKKPFPIDGYITVKRGQTIYDLANIYNLLPQKIVEANNLKSPYNLTINQKLFLP